MELPNLIFFLYFRKKLSELEKEKKPTLEKFLIFWEMEHSSSKLKKLLYFRRELAKLENQNFLIYLCC